MPFEVKFLASYDLDSITAELRRIASLTGRNTVTSGDLIRFGRVSYKTILMKFGNLANANEAAGLAFRRIRKLTSLEVLIMLRDLWKRTQKELGRRPIRSDLKRFGLPFSSEVVTNRFGTWKKALIAASNLPEDAVELTRYKKTRRSVSVGRRYKVFKRDNYTCRLCRRENEPLEVDHIVPVSKGGTDEFDNLQTLCWDCNRGKGVNLQ